MTVLLSHIVVHLFFFFPQIWWFHCYIKQYQHRVCSIFVTCDNFFSIFITCDSFFVTCDSSFLTFGASLTFFSHLTVPSSHCVVPISHVIVLFSHLVVPLLFFFLTFYDFILTLYNSNITCDSSFLTFGGSLTFFLTFDGSIVTLSNTNIASDSIFVTFSGTLFFYSQIWLFHYYIGQYQHYFWPYFCHIRWYPIFFLTIDSSIVTISTTNITSDHNFTFGLIIEVTFLLINNHKSQ